MHDVGMPLLDSAQRKLLTVDERKRMGVLVSGMVREVLTKKEKAELKKLTDKVKFSCGF